MKLSRVIASLLLVSTLTVSAQDLRYRSNDPFVFCRYGYKQTVAEMCWVPVAPYTGAWTYTWMCNEPNYYGRKWKQEDRDSLNQYLMICPQAVNSGEWKGPGDGTEVPFKH